MVPNPRQESAENELHVTNDTFLELGLQPTTLSEGLLPGVVELDERHHVGPLPGDEGEHRERGVQRRQAAGVAEILHQVLARRLQVEQAGEDDELVATINRLQDVDALREAAETALVAIDGADAVGGVGGEEEPASDLIGRAQQALEAASDQDLRDLGARLGEVAGVLSDVSAELGSYTGSLPSDPEELERLLQRQQEIKALTRKYAPDAAGIVAWRDKAQARLAKIDTSEGAVEKLKAKFS